MYNQRPQVRLGFGRGLTPVIKWLLILNVVVFVIQSLDRSGYFTNQLALIPQAVLKVPAFWQVFTYQFLHGGFFHLFFNMFALWMFGTEIETSMGSKRFLKFYLICGTGAGIITVLTCFSLPIFVVGASGAVLGVLVAFAVMFPNRVVLMYFLFPIKVKYLVLIFIGIDLLAAYSGSNDGVAHWTHLGGAIIGFVYMKSGWKVTSIRNKLFNFKRERKFRKQQKEHETNEKMMMEVDKVLDKISKVGYDKLSDKEKKILERASDRLSRRKD